MLKNTSLPGKSIGKKIKKNFYCNRSAQTFNGKSNDTMPFAQLNLIIFELCRPARHECPPTEDLWWRKRNTYFHFPNSWLNWTDGRTRHWNKKKRMYFFHLLNVGHSAEMMVLLLLICGRTATAGNTRSLIVQYMLALRLYHAPTPIVCVRLRTFISTVNPQRCSCKAVNEMWRKKTKFQQQIQLNGMSLVMLWY